MQNFDKFSVEIAFLLLEDGKLPREHTNPPGEK